MLPPGPPGTRADVSINIVALSFVTFLLTCTIAGCDAPAPQADEITLTVVGINDIHGQFSPTADHGGLVGISAYVNALRTARDRDGGAVLVVDAGDMWQGTLASNLGEGAGIIDAYNALGVAAAAIGNHEFDFGPEGTSAIPVRDGDDPRGALKARAREASFPFLAANLIDDATGQPVAWDNVQPSVIVTVGGVPVGIIGVMTANALQTTIAANTTGLSVAPLAESITREARRLHAEGAQIVIVVAHAGGRCTDAADPHDLSSCDLSSELIQVARELDPADVDHIFGGHLEHTMAHFINGISVSKNRKSARSFGRVDFRFNRQTGEVLDRKLFPPQPNVLPRPATYAGEAFEAIPEVAQAAEAALAAAGELQSEKLGVSLEEAFELGHDMESALFNLVTEALLESSGADVVIHNVRGGLRKGLPAGELTFGAVYEMYPFDNFTTIHEISGRDLRRVMVAQSPRTHRTGFAGMRVFVSCDASEMEVRILRPDGSEIGDGDTVRLLANDYLALGGDNILTPVIPEGGFDIRFDLPQTRDTLVAWFRARGGTLRPADWRSHAAPKWNLPGDDFRGCAD